MLRFVTSIAILAACVFALQSPPDSEAQQVSKSILLFKRALRTGDLKTLQSYASANGVYSSALRKVVPVSMLNTSVQEPWDEKTMPVLRIDLLQALTPDVQLAHFCEYQPSLMTTGQYTDMVLVKETGTWRVASMISAGACKP